MDVAKILSHVSIMDCPRQSNLLTLFRAVDLVTT